jgi:beta-xylosidase
MSTYEGNSSKVFQFGAVILRGYKPVSKPITGNYWAQGPTAIKIGDTYMVYFDKYTEHKMGAIESKDLKTWTDISDKVHFPKGVRHGTVIEISENEWAALLMK